LHENAHAGFFDVFLVQQLLNGLAQGLVYALIAIGFTLIFGVLNVVNFAHGEIYMLGAFAGLLAIQVLAPPGFAVLLLVAAAGLVLGVLLERVAFRPFRRFNDEASLKSRRCARPPCCPRWPFPSLPAS
jgi:branched-chain amino acid transport system permease protein